jgi:hypothetical protein
LCSTGYTPNASTDEYYSVAVSSGNIVSAGVALGTKTNVLGLLSAANTTWSSVSGSQVTQLVIYVNGTAGSGDYLLINDSSGTNIPVTPNGGNIVATWDPTNGIGTLFAGLRPRERNKLWEWLNGVLGIPAWKHPDGLTVGEPTLTLTKPTNEQAERHAEWQNRNGLWVREKLILA